MMYRGDDVVKLALTQLTQVRAASWLTEWIQATCVRDCKHRSDRADSLQSITPVSVSSFLRRGAAFAAALGSCASALVFPGLAATVNQAALGDALEAYPWRPFEEVPRPPV